MSSSYRDPRPEPEVRVGMYRRYEDVPTSLRLEAFESKYRDRDVWNEWIEAEDLLTGVGEETRRMYPRVGDTWKEFCAERGEHHALCTPATAIEYAEMLDEKWKIDAKKRYWWNVKRFYDWLFHHPEYDDHRYQPFAIAATESEIAREIWDFVEH